ncbi:MAG: DNA polymerase IV [Spirochaetaceae bacterium]|nr:DNA polymerase IV [Spirochaetaceae bacterium]
MDQIFFHVDLDAFFASVEQHDDPALKGKPVIVGAAPGKRGVVSTCSYEAREFGVHSAMPISEASRRCPAGIFLPVRMKRYAEISKLIMEILGEFTPEMRQLSIDEALLDMTGTQRLWGCPEDAAARIKKRIAEQAGLTVSIGAGPNKYIAKVASGYNKPDGLTIIVPGGEKNFMRSLSIEKLWGAGEKTRKALADIGIGSIAQLQEASPAKLKARFGQAGAKFLITAATGQDPGVFLDETVSRSMSVERTFQFDTCDMESILSLLRQFSDELIARLWSENLCSCCLGIKIRYDDFSSITRQCVRESGYEASEEAYSDAAKLLRQNWDGKRPIRLIGASFMNLQPAGSTQTNLFESGHERESCAQRAVLALQQKGKGRITRARYLKNKPE